MNSYRLTKTCYRGLLLSIYLSVTKLYLKD
nr:MAG TPA: hypothetical protein [Caudoviricetes sp.]